MCGYGPCDSNEGDLLAAAVVDQGHAHVLQRQDDFLFGQLRLLTLTEQLVDPLLLSEEHDTLETFGSTRTILTRLYSGGTFFFLP